MFIFLKDIVLPNLKIGIRKENEDVQTEYILVLEHIVKHSVNYTELNDMKVLIGQDDEEGKIIFSKVSIIFNYIVDKGQLEDYVIIRMI